MPRQIIYIYSATEVGDSLVTAGFALYTMQANEQPKIE
jgi:predicted nucleic acid-binding protein